MLKGLRTQVFEVAHLEKAKGFYTEILERQPYFDREFYVGFNLGGFELGLMPSATMSHGSTTYWAVDDAQAAIDGLVVAGCTVEDPVHDVGDKILLGSVIDPMGNRLGVIQNPHFQLMEVTD